MMSLGCVVIFSMMVSSVVGYPNGPPISACNNMIPSHSASAQTSVAPYQVVVETSNDGEKCYNQNKPLTVQVEGLGNKKFKGVLLQARAAADGAPLGEFQVDGDLGTLDCEGRSRSAVRQTTRLNTNKISVKWSLPSQVGGFPDVNFYATVVDNKETFWVKVQSVQVKYNTVCTSITSGTTLHIASVIMVVATSPILTLFTRL